MGKGSNPCRPILDGLACALRMNEENAYLYASANHAAERYRPAVSRESRVVWLDLRQLLETVRQDVRPQRDETKPLRHP